MSFNKGEGSSGEEDLTGIGTLQVSYLREYWDHFNLAAQFVPQLCVHVHLFVCVLRGGGGECKCVVFCGS